MSDRHKIQTKYINERLTLKIKAKNQSGEKKILNLFGAFEALTKDNFGNDASLIIERIDSDNDYGFLLRESECNPYYIKGIEIESSSSDSKSVEHVIKLLNSQTIREYQIEGVKDDFEMVVKGNESIKTILEPEEEISFELFVDRHHIPSNTLIGEPEILKFKNPYR